MIRYPDALDDIEAAIETVAPGWLRRADERIRLFDRIRGYSEKHEDTMLAPFWSEIKPIFVQRQHNKCIYCETILEGGEYGAIQWDLEHFRPKGRVRRWNGPQFPSPLTYDFPIGEASDIGYFMLSYTPSNYAAACKSCNSCLKSDYFPIAGGRIQAGVNPESYSAESPYLIYPLGTHDSDPAAFIKFDGPKAVPTNSRDADEQAWRKAQIIIDFFDLNREDLERRRAGWLYWAVWRCWRDSAAGDTHASQALEYLQSERSEFSNCSRCFVELCNSDFDQAKQMIAVLHETLVLG